MWKQSCRCQLCRLTRGLWWRRRHLQRQFQHQVGDCLWVQWSRLVLPDSFICICGCGCLLLLGESDWRWLHSLLELLSYNRTYSHSLIQIQLAGSPLRFQHSTKLLSGRRRILRMDIQRWRKDDGRSLGPVAAHLRLHFLYWCLPTTSPRS